MVKESHIGPCYIHSAVSSFFIILCLNMQSFKYDLLQQ